MPRALQRPATTMAILSPHRAVKSEAGTLLSTHPMLISVTGSAAIGTEAPRSRASKATTGMMAPSPMPNSSVGPKAATAIFLNEKSVNFLREAWVLKESDAASPWKKRWQ